ncbi:MAG: InlB B-repeat-containing protein [Coprobacillaceae bacterium]
MRRSKIIFSTLLVCVLFLGQVFPISAMEESTSLEIENNSTKEDDIQIDESIEDSEEIIEDSIINQEGVVEEATILKRDTYSDIGITNRAGGTLVEVSNELDLITGINLGEEYFRVEASFEISNPILIPSGQNVSILGNNYSITTTAGNTEGHFKVEGYLSLGDCSLTSDDTPNRVAGIKVENGGELEFLDMEIINPANTDRVIEVMENASIFISRGRISGCSNGAIYLHDNAKMKTSWSDISNNTADKGAAVYAEKNCNIQIIRGSLSNNKADYGGAIYIDTDSTIKLISHLNDNEAIDGGAIYVNDGNLIIKDSGEAQTVSEYYNNHALNNGGAIYLTEDSVWETGTSGQEDYIFETNIADNYGGAIYSEGTIVPSTTEYGNFLAMYIRNNEAKKGAGMYLTSSAETLIERNIMFSENIVTEDGGGIYNAGKLEINGSDFAYNEATNGAAMYIDTNGEFLYEGDQYFYYNIASGNGGAIYNDGFMDIRPMAEDFYFELVENEAENGGGVYLDANGALTFRRAHKFKDNIATNNGGAIYTNGSIDMYSVEIDGNTAENGGGIYVTQDATAIVFGDSKLTNNTAIKDGGAVYTEDHGDYHNIVSGDYSNIMITGNITFSGNTARILCEPVSGIENIVTNIEYIETSAMKDSQYMHPINNYDINHYRLFTLNYDANNGIGSIPTATYSTVETVTVASNSGFSYGSYDFVEWNTQADGNGTSYQPGSSIIVDGHITLYAIWDQPVSTYQVTYMGNENTGGVVPLDTNLYQNGNTVTVLGKNTLFRDDYTFTGWNTEPNGSGIDYAANDTFVMGTSGVTLYAQWSTIPAPAIQYIVLFESNGGTIVPSQTVLKGTTATVPTNPTKEGYTFVGWYSDSNLTTSYNFNTPVMNNITLYAKWNKVTEPTKPTPEIVDEIEINIGGGRPTGSNQPNTADNSTIGLWGVLVLSSLVLGLFASKRKKI